MTREAQLLAYFRQCELSAQEAVLALLEVWSRPRRLREKEHSSSKILRMQDVCQRLGLSQVTIWRLRRAGDFPLPIALTGKQAIGWSETDIEAWVTTREPPVPIDEKTIQARIAGKRRAQRRRAKRARPRR